MNRVKILVSRLALRLCRKTSSRVLKKLFGIFVIKPAKLKPEYRTKLVFQKYYKKKLSKEDVYEIRMKLKEFGFKLLEIENED